MLLFPDTHGVELVVFGEAITSMVGFSAAFSFNVGGPMGWFSIPLTGKVAVAVDGQSIAV